MKIRFNARKSGGFTMIEVIMSLAIMAVAATGLIACFTGSFFVMQYARENQRATQILIERAEAIRAFSWVNMTNGSIPTSFTNYYYEADNSTNTEGTRYLGTVAIGSVPFSTTYSANMLQVTIGVSWKTRSLSRSRTLKTFVSYNGIQNYVY